MSFWITPVQQEHRFIPNVYHIYAGYPGHLHCKGLAPLNFIEHSTESPCRPRSRNPHREAIQLRRNDKSVVRSWYTCGHKIHAPTYIGELVKEWGEQRRNKVEQLRYFLVGSHLEKTTIKNDKWFKWNMIKCTQTSSIFKWFQKTPTCFHHMFSPQSDLKCRACVNGFSLPSIRVDPLGVDTIPRCRAKAWPISLATIMYQQSKATMQSVWPLKKVVKLSAPAGYRYLEISSYREIWIPEICKDLSPLQTRSPKDLPTTESNSVKECAEERLHVKASSTVASVTAGSRKFISPIPMNTACINMVKSNRAIVWNVPKSPKCPGATQKNCASLPCDLGGYHMGGNGCMLQQFPPFFWVFLILMGMTVWQIYPTTIDPTYLLLHLLHHATPRTTTWRHSQKQQATTKATN